MPPSRHPATADVPLRTPEEPKQARSRRTRERIFAAAEQLLRDRDFGDLTMSDLAKAAGCGVGTLYGHIPGKTALLACLYERHGELSRRKTASLQEKRSGKDLAERARDLCKLVVDVFAEQQGVVRAITDHLFSQAGREVGEFRREMTTSFREAAAYLAECADEMAHDDARDACEFGLLTVVCMAQNRVVYGQMAGIQLRISRKRLIEQLTVMLLAYLQIGSKPR